MLVHKATCFSSTEPSSGLYQRTDPYLIFCTTGIPIVQKSDMDLFFGKGLTTALWS